MEACTLSWYKHSNMCCKLQDKIANNYKSIKTPSWGDTCYVQQDFIGGKKGKTV